MSSDRPLFHARGDDSPLVLRVFRPDESAPELERASQDGNADRPVLSPRMTLGEFSGAYYVPHVLAGKDRSPRTLDEIATSLKYWAELTSDPPLALIDDAWVELFKTRLAAPIVRRVGTLRKRIVLAPQTVRKHCAQLAPILRATGPKRPWNKRGAGVLDDPPEIELPAAGDPRPVDAPNLDALDAIYRACDAADVPRLSWIDAPTWWRALLVCCYETALRIGSLIYVDRSWIRGDHRGLSLYVPRSRYKGRRRGKVFPVNDVAAAWFDVLIAAQRRAGVLDGTPHGDRLFRWPHDPHAGGDPREHNDDFSYLQATRRKIFARAGVSIAGGFHALRRSHATHRAVVDLSAAQRALGHERGRTTAQHYIGEVVGRAIVDGLPQPATFLPHFSQGGSDAPPSPVSD